MAEASGLALRLDAGKIPLREGATPEMALTEGEDYELLFAVPERLRSRLESAWDFPDTKLTCLGRFVRGTPGQVSGVNENLINTGYDHFR